MNGWDTGANPMQDNDGDGVWETTLNLDPGRYEYKFVVNGDQWFTDDFAMDESPDGFGGHNAVVIVKDKPLILGPGGNVPPKGQAPTEGLHEVTFRYKPAGKVNKVTLAGTFNDWNADKTAMTGPDKNGEYTVTLLLPAGDYQYKFVADGNWITDRAHADSFTDDGFGGQNSVIKVDDRFPVLKVEKGDGKISDVGLDYTQTGSTVNDMGGGRVELSFKSQRNDIEGMDVLLSDATGERTLPASVTGRDQAFSYWRVTVTGAPASFRYLPAYKDGGTTEYLTADGLVATKPAADAWWSFTTTAFPPFETPDWVKDAVIYQIFPDRFRNGDPGNDPDFTEWYYAGKTTLPPSGKTNGEYYHLVKDWYDIAGLTKSPYRTDGKPDYFSFYGGDIAGVQESLDYLKDLGVTAIYFNPLFQAKSNHKYDCATYMKLDPHFGTNEEFKQFVAAAHAKGIRIILDIVFNHTGNTHWAFQDAVKKGPESKYYDWYEFKKWPLPPSFGPNGPKPEDYYYCWWGFGDLPDLNYDLSRPNPQENAIRNSSEAKVNQPLVDHLMDVTQYWIGNMDADGVRLDVPNEVPFWFWKEFNQKVKGIKKDAYIVGEIWGNASDWVGPTMFDATMNYAYFRDPVVKFLGQGRGSAQEFDRTLATGRNAYPTQAVQVMMNLVDSHDTVRFRQQVGGDLNRVKLAKLFAMTYVGAPHIYYGDEIGMMGGGDPDCRRPFLWNWKQDPERVALHDYVATLAKARAAHEALRRGDFTTLVASGPIYAYLRTAGSDRVVVALNAGGAPAKASLDLSKLGNPTQAVNLATGETVPLGDGTLNLDPESGVALALQ
jgi:cyclomaltodextrinase